MIKLTSLLLSAILANGDVYMHMPRGSNNRLNEKSANRNNGNRLYDSQNNNRGGYNVGDKTDQAFNPNDPELDLAETYSVLDNTPVQYPMVYFEGSILPIEWTNQHGCGGNEENDPHKLNCNMVIQYMCDSDPENVAKTSGMYVRLRDGGNTNTPDAPNGFGNIITTQQNNNGNQRGRHESEGYYHECQTRQRNYGLFTADQNLNNQDARSTRQNPNGNRRGLECPEERDYYPYWTATPWRDVAYVTDEVDQMCGDNGYIAQNSQNNNEVYKCEGPEENNQQIPITERGCMAAGGTWTAYTHGIDAPDCFQAEWTRVNHLGNNRHGQPVTYNWTLPTLEEVGATGARLYDGKYARCVVRLRYNISTDDYDPWNTNSTMNEQNGQRSPVEQNPTMPVRLGGDLQGLRLAINTAQFGRTFQDRSHVFTIKKRPASMAENTIYNLNVRGKRGNIVQTFPAVEYDFVPNRLHISNRDLIHVQWTGSNTHNNGNPAGDGQAGDAGEGTGGTDRSNMVQIANMDTNFPIPLDKMTDNMFSASTCRNFNGESLGNWQTCALIMATSGQFRTWDEVDEDEWNVTLDTAPASLVGGVIMQFQKTGEYNYIGSRNNNFSNRSQKGVLIVE